MTDDARRWKVTQLRREVSFLVGDRGGPDHSVEIAKLNAEIKELQLEKSDD
jgi:hypothetical protein